MSLTAFIQRFKSLLLKEESEPSSNAPTNYIFMWFDSVAGAVKFKNSAGTVTTISGGSGDVVGPGSAVNNNFAVFDGTTGKLIKDSGYSYSTFAPASHSHAQSDITNLVTDLAGKAAASHTHAASDITSGTVAAARLGSGTPSASNFLRGDGAWATAGQGLISIGRFEAVGGEYVMEVDGLDLDADEFYFYQFNFNFQGTAALKEILGVFNTDTISTDYTKQAPNGFTTDYSSNDAKIDSGTFGTGAARAGCGNIFKIVVSSAGGSDKYPAYTCNITLGSQGTSFICLKNFGATNITKFSIMISTPSGSITFSAGSFLEVFKLR